MSPAGMNLQVHFIRLTESDDDVGGSMTTGTVIYNNVQGRIDPLPSDTMLMQQGLETKKLFSCMVWPGTLLVREYDEIQVVSPPNSSYFGQKFRVEDVTYSSNHPDQKRDCINLILTRSQIAHGNNYQ